MGKAEEGSRALTSGPCTYVHTGADIHTYTHKLTCIYATYQMHKHMKISLKKKEAKNCILTTDLSLSLCFEIVLFKIKLEHS